MPNKYDPCRKLEILKGMAELPPYQLIRSRKRRKTISLQIRREGGIIVHAPHFTPISEIERFIMAKRKWVFRNLSEKEEMRRMMEKTFVEGEQFLYLGAFYPLKISDNPPGETLKLSSGRFILNRDFACHAREAFIEWYRKEAAVRLRERVEDLSYRFQLFPKSLRITSARYRWGSCSGDDRLSLSWRLIMAPLDVINYITVHELVHIKEKNHSSTFWRYLERIFPDYRRCTLWLRGNGHLLQI